ncbi:MAG: GGDEF domain-containing protein [bacterium]|nr:GGDEF domain-containing protein [bacterium]
MVKVSKKIILISLLLLVFFVVNGIFLFLITNYIKYDARIVNYAGIVRGSIQRAVKLEMCGKKADEIIEKTDIILELLLEKNYRFKLYGIRDRPFFDSIQELNKKWDALKSKLEIYGKNKDSRIRADILILSEECWNLANTSVFEAQFISESKFKYMNFILLGTLVNLCLIILIILMVKKWVYDKLEFSALYDNLTKCYNRASFYFHLKNEIRRAERYNSSLSVIMFDADYFKEINDNYGHDIGDSVLRTIADICQKSLRKNDYFARIGGEEFAIIALETTLKQAFIVAEKLRIVLSRHVFRYDLKVTVSLGVAQYAKGDTEDDIMKRADVALYKAKHNGRNRVEMEDL